MADLDSQIYLSRDEIRNQIISYMQEYLELENVDLTNSSFLSFIVNIISTLTSNLMFYQSSIYKEFFLTRAQLPESILNLAAFLGYNPASAQYSEVDVMLSIPLTFEDPLVEIIMPEHFSFHTKDNINFLTTYITKLTITNNNSVRIQITENEGTIDIPVHIDTPSNTFNFLLPLKQYELTKQEFQIPEDTPLYQFIYIDVPFENQISSMIVKVVAPGNEDDNFEIYTKYDSVYLMGSDDKGYVARRSEYGYRLYFGNGIMGKQPEPGSKILVDGFITRGSEGNIISASINRGEQIYITTQSGQTEIVNYDVTNPSPAINGLDEEEIEDTRGNAIDNLTTLHRLVSEEDYKKLNIVATGSPLAENSMPVLKRSDVKTNEIQVFTTFNYINEIVPARNAAIIIPGTQLYIPRGSIIPIDGVNFITLFDMHVDKLNQVTYYEYILNSIEISPVFQAGYNSGFSLFSNKVNVYRNGEEAIFEITYSSFENTLDKLSCTMEISNLGSQSLMVHDEINKTFSLTVDEYTSLPNGINRYYFTFRHDDLGLISQYTVDLAFRKSLKDMMMSNTYTDSTSTIIYDIPVIEKEFYDNTDQKIFELQILQKMLDTLEFKTYKMLTDFVNLKFTNSTGIMRNMLLNKTTRLSVIDYDMSAIPIDITEGDRYIISGDELYEWTGRKNQIATCTDATNVTWVYSIPVMDDMVFIENEGKNFIFTESGWIPAEFTIPLEIELDVLKNLNYNGSMTQLMDKIKEALYDKFKDRFGANIAIYRSEIIREVQNVEGVDHCKLIKPEANIFFNFNIDDFTEQELLVYTPEYVFFTKDNIKVRILTSGV